MGADRKQLRIPFLTILLNFKSRSMRQSFVFFTSFLVISLVNSISVWSQDVLTQHNNLDRTGWNDRETILNKSNVKPGSFGKLFTRKVDDQLYAQPLVKTDVNILSI